MNARLQPIAATPLLADRSSTIWPALRRRDYLLSWWPLRAIAYLISGIVTAVTTLVVLIVLAVLGCALAVVLVGLPLLVAVVLSGIPLGTVERARLRLVDARPITDPHVPSEGGLLSVLRVRAGEPATWRELCYVGVFCLLLWPIALIVVAAACLPAACCYAAMSLLIRLDPAVTVLPGWTLHGAWSAPLLLLVALVLLPVVAYLAGITAALHGGLSRLLLSARDAEASARLIQLAASRSRLVAAFEAERRRLERDLHDGAQQRLVALNITLGLARASEPDGVDDYLAQAQQELAAAMLELRELIQGIQPRLLTDRGLVAALEDVADRSPVPVSLTINLASRLPEPVESAAYFAVCEALVNVAKHSRATGASVDCALVGSRLRIEVRDDGHGGAVEGNGSGLTGIRDRLAVLDGTLTLSSPSGGPTVLQMGLPIAEYPDSSARLAQGR